MVESNNGEARSVELNSVSKYLLAHRNLGRPFTVLILITFPSASSLPESDFLARRFTEVQKHWPISSCTLIDQRTSRPKLKEHPIAWTERDLLFHHTYEPGKDEITDRNWVGSDVLHSFPNEVESPLEPLWRVTIYTSSVDPENRPAYLAFTIDHVLTDGRGAVMFIQALLEPDSIEDLPVETLETYSSHSTRFSVRPQLYTIVTQLFNAFVVPRLPLLVRRLLGFPPAFPAIPQRPIADCQWRCSFFDIDQSLIEKVKARGKENGVKTLNPILQTAWSFSLRSVFGQTMSPFVLKSISVKDLRAQQNGGPYCLAMTGVSLTHWMHLSNDAEFWDIARRYARPEDSAVFKGLESLRMLNLIPSAPITPSSSSVGFLQDDLPRGDKRAHTQLEKMIADKLVSSSPSDGISGVFSNAGLVKLPQGATDLSFGISGAIFGNPLFTAAIGHERGVRLQNVWNEGAVMTEKEEKEFERVFVEMLLSVGRGDSGF